MRVAEPAPNRISLCPEGDEALIVLEPGAFYFKGERIEDAQKVYERFKQFLDTAKITKPE
jgi:hypothetical protein